MRFAAISAACGPGFAPGRPVEGGVLQSGTTPLCLCVGRLRARSAPSSSGLGPRPFTAVARVRIPLGSLEMGQAKQEVSTAIQYGPVAQLVSVPPCHGGGRGFKSRQGREARRPFEREGVAVSGSCFAAAAAL